MPTLPPIRNSGFSDELMKSYDRARQLRAAIAKLEDELAPLEKRLTWTLMPQAFGREHWGPHCPSPADDALDEDKVRHAPRGGCQVDADWPFLQHDRKILHAAWREWKKREGR
jgi:hypothetical protein